MIDGGGKNVASPLELHLGVETRRDEQIWDIGNNRRFVLFQFAIESSISALN